jgi:hypothetical protein
MNGPRFVLFRVFRHSICFFMAATFILPKAALSQPGPGGMLFGPGPKTIGIQYDYFDISGAHQITLQISRGPDMGIMRMSMLTLAGGVRFGYRDSTEFRWRAGLLDADMIRKFLSFGGTLLDYNKTGMLETDFTYINLRLGPVLRLGNPRFAAIARVVGSVGGSAIVLGETNYPGAELDEDKELSGGEAGYRSILSLLFMGRFTVSAEYGERIIGSKPEPHFKTFGVGAQLRLGEERFGGKNLFLRFERQEFSLSENSFKQVGNQIKVGLQILPSPRGGRGFPEE